MPSQFLGLYIAGTGLRASNASLNTTANNIANSQTEGYSRQQATKQANEALRVFTTYGCVGAGVNTLAIERIRDSFYDVKYWDNNSKYGEYSVKEYYMKTIEDYFDDDNTSGFRSIFNKFSASLQSVTTNSSSDSTKAEFIAAAKSLTDYFNNMYGNLQELQKDINLEIKQCVDEINSLAEKISVLNKQINTIEISGPMANELRDQRELLIDRLSELVDVEVRETPIYDASKGESGANRYMVFIAGGQVLVDGEAYKSLTYEARDKDEKVNLTDADGLYDIKWDNGNSFRLTNAAMGGKLKGLVELRDGNNGANFNGIVKNTGQVEKVGAGDQLTVDGSGVVNAGGDPITLLSSTKVTLNGTTTVEMPDGTDKPLDAGTTLYINSAGNIILEDGTAVTLPTGSLTATVVDEVEAVSFGVGKSGAISVEVTDEYLKSMQECMLSDVGGVISIGNVVYYYDSWAYDGNNTYTFVLDETKSPNPQNIKLNSDVKTEAQIKYEGIPYYMDQMNAWIRSFAEKVNEIFTQGVDANGDPGALFFTGYNGSGEKEYTKADLVANGYYNLTAGNFSINSELLLHSYRLGSRSSKEVGVEECGQIKELISLLASKEKFSFRNGTAGQMLERILSDVSVNTNDAIIFSSNYAALRNSIDNQRNSISGVDEDEEAVNLVKFQNAYTLSSKMIQTLTEIYDQLILRTGV